MIEIPKQTKRPLSPIILQYRAIRKHKGMSTQDVADLCGVSRSMIEKIESGWRVPRISMMEMLAHAVGGELIIGGWY